jgi:hypothetical protein
MTEFDEDALRETLGWVLCDGLNKSKTVEQLVDDLADNRVDLDKVPVQLLNRIIDDINRGIELVRLAIERREQH